MSSYRGSHPDGYRERNERPNGGGRGGQSGGRDRYQGKRGGGGRSGRGRGQYGREDGRDGDRDLEGERDNHERSRNGFSNQHGDVDSTSRRGGRGDYSNDRRDTSRYRGQRQAAPFSPRSPRSDRGHPDNRHQPFSPHVDDPNVEPHPATLPTEHEPQHTPPPLVQQHAPPPPPPPPPFSLDLFPEDQLKLVTIQGLMQPYLPFWIQPLPALDDHQPSNWIANNPIPHFVRTCCNSLSQWLRDSSPQVISRWFVDTWLALHPMVPAPGRPKEPVKIKLFDAVWTVWATTAPESHGHGVEPASVVACALAALASVFIHQQPRGSSTFDPVSTMPFAALVHLVDFTAPSSLHTLIAEPVLRQLPAMDMAAAADASSDNQPPPFKRPRMHHRDRGRDRERHHLSSSRSNAQIPPPIPPFLSSTLTYSISPTQVTSVALFFSHMLRFGPLLDPLRDLILAQASDPRLKIALLDAFIAHCASPTTQGGHETLDLSATSHAHLYTDALTLGGVARSLLRHLPMAHLAAHPPLLAMLHAYFAQPTTRLAPHLLFADLRLPAQSMLDLMLALASSPTPTWMHHVLIPVFDALVGAVDLAAVPLAAWDVFCHVLDTPVLARSMLRQLCHKDGPIVAAVMRVMAGYEPAELELVAVDATAQESKVKIEAGCVHGHAPAAWPGSADNVPLMLREWTWRWTAGRKLMDSGVIEDLVRVDFSGLPALAEMQLKVVAKQVARYVDARGSTAADEVLQRLVHVIMTAEHAPREAARVLAVVLGAVAKDHELLEGVLARGLFNAFSTTLDEEQVEGDDPGRELTPAECAIVLERMVPMLLSMPMCTQLQSSVAAADKQVCPVVYGLVSMLFGSNKTFGLVLHRVFHYAAPDVAQQFLAWLAQLARIVSPARAGQVVGISSETVAGAILYTANADVRKASGMARVLEHIGRCMLLGAGTLGMVDGVDAVIAVRAELYDYLLFEFFKEFTRLADKRVALESVHSLWNRNARSGNDGHARDTGGFGESVTEKEMVSLGIDTLAIAPAILDPASARRPPSQSDWTHATKAAAAALTHLHQRLDHLAVGFTVLYSAWDLQQIDLMLSASGLPAHPSGRVPLVTHIVNVLTMSGTHPETGVSWSFPSPYLLQVLARIGTDASLAFVTIVGHQLADQLGHCDHVPNAIVNAVYKAMYAVLISALQHKQDPAVQVPFTLLVKVFASVLMVDKELWPMWQRAVASVPEMRRDEVTRDMYQELVQQVLGPVEQRAAVDLWWCAVEGIVRRKVPMPV